MEQFKQRQRGMYSAKTLGVCIILFAINVTRGQLDIPGNYEYYQRNRWARNDWKDPETPFTSATASTPHKNHAQSSDPYSRYWTEPKDPWTLPSGAAAHPSEEKSDWTDSLASPGMTHQYSVWTDSGQSYYSNNDGTKEQGYSRTPSYNSERSQRHYDRPSYSSSSYQGWTPPTSPQRHIDYTYTKSRDSKEWAPRSQEQGSQEQSDKFQSRMSEEDLSWNDRDREPISGSPEFLENPRKGNDWTETHHSATDSPYKPSAYPSGGGENQRKSDYDYNYPSTHSNNYNNDKENYPSTYTKNTYNYESYDQDFPNYPSNDRRDNSKNDYNYPSRSKNDYTQSNYPQKTDHSSSYPPSNPGNSKTKSNNYNYPPPSTRTSYEPKNKYNYPASHSKKYNYPTSYDKIPTSSPYSSYDGANSASQRQSKNLYSQTATRSKVNYNYSPSYDSSVNYDYPSSNYNYPNSKPKDYYNYPSSKDTKDSYPSYSKTKDTYEYPSKTRETYDYPSSSKSNYNYPTKKSHYDYSSSSSHSYYASSSAPVRTSYPAPSSSHRSHKTKRNDNVPALIIDIIPAPPLPPSTAFPTTVTPPIVQPSYLPESTRSPWSMANDHHYNFDEYFDKVFNAPSNPPAVPPSDVDMSLSIPPIYNNELNMIDTGYSQTDIVGPVEFDSTPHAHTPWPSVKKMGKKKRKGRRNDFLKDSLIKYNLEKVVNGWQEMCAYWLPKKKYHLCNKKQRYSLDRYN